MSCRATSREPPRYMYRCHLGCILLKTAANVADRGSLCVKLPLPPSCFSTLYNNDEGFVEEYLAANPGYYTTGDAGVIDSNGYVSVLVSAAAPFASSEALSSKKLAAA